MADTAIVMIVRFVGLLIFFLSCSFLLQAQERCGTVPYMQTLMEKKGISQKTEQFEEWLQNKISQRKKSNNFRTQAAGPYHVPVVVHVIHNGQPIGTTMNISDSQIISQIQVLNADFKRLNSDASNTPSDFLLVAGSLNIEFVLAKQTPEGLPSNGIIRLDGLRPSWSVNQDEELKALSYWPSEDYLNIWVTNIGGGFLGYAQFPVSNLSGLEEFQDGLAPTDGVVIDYTVFGVGSSDPKYNLGRTTTHEVGHFFGLRHIWGDTDDCSGTDYVSDTPNQLDETYNCPGHPLTDCSSFKMFQNYMDYTDDVCMNLFTLGQADRMSIILEDTDVPRRSSLLTSHGLEDPICGSNPPVDIAIVNARQPGPVTCNDNPQLVIAVKNISCPIITSLTVDYQINSGSILSKTVTGLSLFNDGSETAIEIGTLNLDEETENTISLNISLVNGVADSNPGNSETNITIIHNSAGDVIPLLKTFNDNLIDNWTVANPLAGINWGVDQSQARFPSGPLNGQPGEESWLTTPVLDLSYVNEASVFFNLTYTWNGQDNDRLRILASTDCGDTYVPTAFDSLGGALNSAGEKKYLSISSLAGFSNVRLAFVGTNDQGSNIYVDNIEFFVSDDPTPIEPGNELYALYWNSDGGVDITFNLSERQPVNLSVVDIMGREIERGALPNVLNQTFSLPFQYVTSGLYIIRLQIGKSYYATKVYLTP